MPGEEAVIRTPVKKSITRVRRIRCPHCKANLRLEWRPGGEKPVVLGFAEAVKQIESFAYTGR